MIKYKQPFTNATTPKFGDRLRPRRREAISVASDDIMEPTAVAEVVEEFPLGARNAATASPHRLEMSTEFFVIPPRYMNPTLFIANILPYFPLFYLFLRLDNYIKNYVKGI